MFFDTQNLVRENSRKTHVLVSDVSKMRHIQCNCFLLLNWCIFLMSAYIKWEKTKKKYFQVRFFVNNKSESEKVILSKVDWLKEADSWFFFHYQVRKLKLFSFVVGTVNLFSRLSNKCSIKLILDLIKKAALMSEYNGKIHEEKLLLPHMYFSVESPNWVWDLWLYQVCSSKSRYYYAWRLGWKKYFCFRTSVANK